MRGKGSKIREHEGGAIMGVLTEYLKTEAEQLQAEARKQEEAKAEWVSSIRRLHETLRQWAQEADGGRGLLRVTSDVVEISDPRLGVYSADVLCVSLRNRAVRIGPLSRYALATIKPPGRELCPVDGMAVVKDGSAPEYYLFRIKGDEGDHWYIQNVTRWNSDPEYGNVEELDRDRFEAAILRILK
jgi:hypothetical protein